MGATVKEVCTVTFLVHAKDLKCFAQSQFAPFHNDIAVQREIAVHKRSTESIESVFLLLLKCIIVSMSSAEREGRGHRELPLGSQGHRQLLNCRTGTGCLCCYQTVTKPNTDT